MTYERWERIRDLLHLGIMVLVLVSLLGIWREASLADQHSLESNRILKERNALFDELKRCACR